MARYKYRQYFIYDLIVQPENRLGIKFGECYLIHEEEL